VSGRKIDLNLRGKLNTSGKDKKKKINCSRAQLRRYSVLCDSNFETILKAWFQSLKSSLRLELDPD